MRNIFISPRRRLRFAAAFAAVALGLVIGIYFVLGDRVTSSEVGVPGPAGAARALPDLRFQNATGKPVSLSDFRGRFVLLNIWATWCVPCRKEMPALDRLQQKLGGGDFEVVALSIDRAGPTAVRPFYEEIQIRALAIYADPAVEVTSKLKTLGIPTTILIDRNGHELWRKTGPAEWDAPDIVETLRRHIRGTTDVRG